MNPLPTGPFTRGHPIRSPGSDKRQRRTSVGVAGAGYCASFDQLLSKAVYIILSPCTRYRLSVSDNTTTEQYCPLVGFVVPANSVLEREKASPQMIVLRPKRKDYDQLVESIMRCYR